VFKRINKQLHSLTTLELQYVAPALVRAQVGPWAGRGCPG
jgi:FKBP12-rapamycin complex-associated protein